MRTIKFRGKRKDNGEWAFGYYTFKFTNYDYSHKKHIIEFYDEYGNFYEVEIIPETLGQFTGLLDKNGKEIYEGDIIQREDGRKDTVVYELGEFITKEKGWELNWLIKHRLGGFGEEITVIGNVHEKEGE